MTSNAAFEKGQREFEKEMGLGKKGIYSIFKRFDEGGAPPIFEKISKFVGASGKMYELFFYYCEDTKKGIVGTCMQIASYAVQKKGMANKIVWVWPWDKCDPNIPAIEKSLMKPHITEGELRGGLISKKSRRFHSISKKVFGFDYIISVESPFVEGHLLLGLYARKFTFKDEDIIPMLKIAPSISL